MDNHGSGDPGNETDETGNQGGYRMDREDDEFMTKMPTPPDDLVDEYAEIGDTRQPIDTTLTNDVDLSDAEPPQLTGVSTEIRRRAWLDIVSDLLGESGRPVEVTTGTLMTAWTDAGMAAAPGGTACLYRFISQLIADRGAERLRQGSYRLLPQAPWHIRQRISEEAEIPADEDDLLA